MEVDSIEESDKELKSIMAVMMRDEKREIKEANDEMLSIIKSLGGDGAKYRRDRQRALRAVVSEIYSPRGLLPQRSCYRS